MVCSTHPPVPDDADSIRGHAFHDYSPPPPLADSNPFVQGGSPCDGEMRADPARDATRGGHYVPDPVQVGMHLIVDREARRRIAEQAAEVMGLKHAECGKCGHWWCYSHGPDPYVCPCCTDPDHIAPWLYVAREDLG